MLDIHFNKKVHSFESFDQMMTKFNVERPSDTDRAFLVKRAHRHLVTYAALSPLALQLCDTRMLVFAGSEEELNNKIADLAEEI